MIESIFLDMDGVLVDFYSGALKAYKEFLKIENIYGPHKQQVYQLKEGMDNDKVKFWREIDKLGISFWTELQQFDWAYFLWEFCNEITPNTYILSKPSRHAIMSSSGKHIWIKEHLGNDSKYVFTPHKHFLAAPGRILIDDKKQHIKDWRANGGIGLFFNSIWEDEDSLNFKELVSTISELNS